MSRRTGKLERSPYDDVYGALEKAAERRRASSATLATALAAAIETLPEFEDALVEYDAALARARDLCPAGVDFEWPANADEPEWPEDATRLAELVQAGPRRPHAEETASLAEARRRREASENTVIAQAVRTWTFDGSFGRLEHLRRLDRIRALSLAERMVDDAIAEREANAAGPEVLTLNERGEQMARLKEVLERRLDRIRELAGEVGVAA